MLILIRLVFLAIALYMFVSLFLENFDNPKNAIPYKIYIFLFVFLLNFLFQFFTHITNLKKVPINEFIESSINDALIAVIAYDIYNNLTYLNFYKAYNTQQKNLMLVLLIIGFITVIKVVELLISC